ncbi:MAG: VCBS repeat-containing protein [Planctomycetota bacterium]|nr:VCBS repeat-containing protein [Planctomycetota bacterium]
MKRQRLFSTSLVLAALGSLYTSALAWQGQPVTIDDREAGLVVREVIEGRTTALGGAPMFTVSGPPGSIYEIFGGVSFFIPGFDVDVQTSVAGVRGPLSAPVLNLAPGLFAPRTGVYGVIPPSGRQDIDLNPLSPIPVGLAGFFLDVQMLMQRPGNPTPPLTLSNGQLRQVQAVVLPAMTWTIGTQYPTSVAQGVRWTDIEQGDVDGDGDNDTVGAGTRGVELWLTTAGVHTPAPTMLLGTGSANSCELADFNNDGFLDLAAAFGGAQFLRVWLNQGLDPAGTWLGFSEMSSSKVGFPTALGGSSPADLEVADLDGDGDRDIFLACSLTAVVGLRNRMFFNDFAQLGAPSFKDVTATNLPDIRDDSEDCEIFDFDLDGDLDVVIANVDGVFPATPFGEGGDYILVNDGGAQGGTRGMFKAPLPNPIGVIANDESLDVAVGDVNGDGLPDLFFSNWAVTNGPGAFTGSPRRNRLLQRSFDPLTGAPIFVDVSSRLPDQAPGAANFATDAEIVDVDSDGDLDIVSALGTLGGVSIFNPGVIPNVSTGLLILRNPSPTGPFAVTIPNPLVSTFDFRDIEHGDWREIGSMGGFGRFFDLDFGCALTGATASLTTLDHD